MEIRKAIAYWINRKEISTDKFNKEACDVNLKVLEAELKGINFACKELKKNNKKDGLPLTPEQKI